MGHPTLEDARRLAEWAPPRGVLSVYLDFDPADRSGAWRTELRNGLDRVLALADDFDHERRTAVRATVDHISERFANEDRSLPRGVVGFVEISDALAQERWWKTQLPLGAAAGIRLDGRPVVAPLIGLIERAAPRGVALISAERVRLLEWQPRTLEELHIWELNVFSRDWRERKAQRVPDPARGHGVSSSGRERFGDRLSDSRHRFLRECRRLALEVAAERDWLTMLTFGQPPQVEDFHQGSEPAGAPIEIGAELDLVGTPLGEVEAIVEEALERLSAQRAARLANQALEGAEAGRRGTAGPQATMAALEEGRVGHLLLDADLADLVAPGRREPRGSKDGEPVDAEELVRRSLATGARITVVTGEAAERLARFRGVAAILRY